MNKPHIHAELLNLPKPSIDWSHIGKKFNYLARSKTGIPWLFEIKPFLSAKSWDYPIFLNGEKFERRKADAFYSYCSGACDFADSLVIRPGVRETEFIFWQRRVIGVDGKVFCGCEHFGRDK